MKKHIVCFGDSNTHGYCAMNDGRFDENERWTCLLQKSLGEDYLILEEGLSGRTTSFRDPVFEGLSGLDYLYPCLMSHEPVDLLVIMLGTNDLKSRFSVTPFDIGVSMENLVKTVLKSDSGIDFEPPKILLVTPVPIHSVNRPMDLDQMIPDMENRSKALSNYYEDIAKRYNLAYLDPAGKVEVNEIDGIHYTEKGHAQMAELMEKKIKEILESV